MRTALLAGTSHPVVTINTRDAIEAEIAARARADENRTEAERHAAEMAHHISNPAVSIGFRVPGAVPVLDVDGVPASPEGLDG